VICPNWLLFRFVIGFPRLKISAITVMRDWQFAKAWLTREMMQAP